MDPISRKIFGVILGPDGSSHYVSMVIRWVMFGRMATLIARPVVQVF
jgi:hypothetical protein